MAVLGSLVGLFGALALTAHYSYQVYLSFSGRRTLDDKYFVSDPTFGLLWIGVALLLVSGGLAVARSVYGNQ